MIDKQKSQKRNELKRRLRYWYLYNPRTEIIKDRLDFLHESLEEQKKMQCEDELDKAINDKKISAIYEEIKDREKELEIFKKNKQAISTALSYIDSESRDMIEAHIMAKIPIKTLAEKYFLHEKTIRNKILKGLNEMMIVLGY